MAAAKSAFAPQKHAHDRKGDDGGAHAYVGEAPTKAWHAWPGIAHGANDCLHLARGGLDEWRAILARQHAVGLRVADELLGGRIGVACRSRPHFRLRID